MPDSREDTRAVPATTGRAVTSLGLAPMAFVERIGHVLDASVWRSLSDDPQLLLLGELPRSAERLFLFEVDVIAIEGGSGLPALYFDFGYGAAANVVSLGRTYLSKKPYSAVVRVDTPPQRIRLDPCAATGEFLCSEVIVSTINAAQAAAARAPITAVPRSTAGTVIHDSSAALSREGSLLPRSQRVGAVLHLFYEDLWPEMAEYIGRIPVLERLYVSVPQSASRDIEERIRNQFPFALVRRVPNRGRDVLPFLQWLEVASMHGVDVICKLHTKRSPHVSSGEAWRRDMLDKLLGSPAVVLEALTAFRVEPSLGIIGPGGHVVPSSYHWDRNASLVEHLCLRMGRDMRNVRFNYVAGSMFWARVDALLPLRSLELRDEHFETEAGSVDGALHHALERCFPIAAELAGFQLSETANPGGTVVNDFAPPPPRSHTYQRWIEDFEVPPERYPSLAAKHAGWRDPPLISLILPTYNTRPDDLRAVLDSVQAQLYQRWELCVADDASNLPHVREILEEECRGDARIKVVYRSENGHIAAASNSALEIATGDFVALLDHDDLLHPLALHYVAEAIVANPGCALVFTDEDKMAPDGIRQDPYFKCELNYELLLAHNMISHLGCYRAERVRQLGGFRVGFEGSQDYDLVLRFIEGLDPAQVIHVPRICYHWRISAGSTALAGKEKPYAQIAARKAISEHLERTGCKGEVMAAPEIPGMNRVRFAIADPAPHVSIVIPTRDRADLLDRCVDSILTRTSYPNYSIVVVDNGSLESTTFEAFARLAKAGVEIRRDDSEFNFSAINNRAVRSVSSEFVCLMNNDIEVLNPDWLEEMVGMGQRPGVGAVGARLWFPDQRLQHGGVILGIGGVAGHSHKYMTKGPVGYFGRAVLHQAMSAVTAACMLVRRRIYEEVGGLDETLKIAFNDIDFCLRVRAAGYRNVWTPYAEMIHHESASRGYETSPEKQARFNSEVAWMQERWGETLFKDPAYSPNLTLDHEDFRIAWPPRVESFARESTAG